MNTSEQDEKNGQIAFEKKNSEQYFSNEHCKSGRILLSSIG